MKQKTKTRQIVKTGDVVAIPLPDGRIAFGRQMGEVTAIYSVLSNSTQPPVGHRKFLFAVGVYADVLSGLDWPKVGKDPATPEEVEFASIGCVHDRCDGKFSLYLPSRPDELSPSTREACYGLEPVSACDRDYIEQRILSTINGSRKVEADECWIPYGLDLTVPGKFKRIPIEEILS